MINLLSVFFDSPSEMPVSSLNPPIKCNSNLKYKHEVKILTAKPVDGQDFRSNS